MQASVIQKNTPMNACYQEYDIVQYLILIFDMISYFWSDQEYDIVRYLILIFDM